MNTQGMNWLLLTFAGFFEVAFAACLGKAKETTGNVMYLWYAGFIISLAVSMLLLMKAIQGLPVGTAYAVWTGIGAVGTAIIGMVFFKDPASFWRVFFLFTIVASIIGLKVTSQYA
jgi:quaternary ammonium compound-resistance protein SugE